MKNALQIIGGLILFIFTFALFGLGIYAGIKIISHLF